MAEYNEIEEIVIPEVPKVLENEQISVYVPIATYDYPGIIKPFRQHFEFDNSDYSLKLKQSIVDTIGVGVPIVPPDRLDESGLVRLANSTYVNLNRHVDAKMDQDDVATGIDPHNGRATINQAIDSHNTDPKSHPLILADVSRNTARVALVEQGIIQLENDVGKVELETIAKNLKGAINEVNTIAKRANERANINEQDISQLESDVGKADLETIAKNLKAAVNEVNTIAKRAKEHAKTNETQLISMNAQLQGVGRTYSLEDFNEFLNFINGSTMLPIYEDRNGDGITEQYIISVADLKTGDNILLAEQEVPDFWFEKTQTESDKTYEYDGTEHFLNAYFNGALVGVLHILETDYQVIAGHAMSAGQSAVNAAASALEAKETEASIDKMVDELYFNQIAPPYDELENSVFLATPTYEML